MPSAGFKAAIPTIKKLQTYALDCRATAIIPYKNSMYLRKNVIKQFVATH